MPLPTSTRQGGAPEQKKLGSLHRANRARKLPARPAEGSSSQPSNNSTGWPRSGNPLGKTWIRTVSSF